MFTYTLLHMRIGTKQLFTTVIIYNNWQDISFKFKISIIQSIGYINQIDKVYQLNQQDILLKLQ